MKKQLLATVLTLCLIVGLLPTPALAAGDTVWTDEVTAQPAGYTVEEGSGDVTISSAEGLAWLAKQVNVQQHSFAGKTIMLTDNIDLSAHEWVPIGTRTSPFSGTFDGDGNTISGLVLNAPASDDTCVGLFGFVQSGTLQDLTISHAVIQATADNASFLWAFGTLAGSVLSTEIQNITVLGTQAKLSIEDCAYGLMGGVVGLADFITGASSSLPASTISHCTVEDLSVTYAGAADYHISTGGILGGQGKVASDNSAIGIGNPMTFSGLATVLEHCTVQDFSVSRHADSPSSPYEMMGGIVGYARSAGSISNCSTQGLDMEISAQVPTPSLGGGWGATAIYGIYGGGIAGCLDGGLIVSHCTSQGEISADVTGGFNIVVKSGSPISGGFFGGITGLIGSMPEKDGWGDLSYDGAGAQILNSYANIAFSGENQESMRHASALYATGSSREVTIKVENFFTSCTFSGAAYPDGLDYNNGYPLLGPNAHSSAKPTQSYKNIFLVTPVRMKAGVASVPASYGAFYNGGWYGENYWEDFKGETGSEAYRSDDAQMNGGEELLFAQGGTFPVEATIIKEDRTQINFSFPVIVDGPDTFTITASAGAHGTISPQGSVEVISGENQEFNFRPDTGYQVLDVLVNGSSIGSPTSYEFSNVTAAFTIEVQFAPISYTITYDLDGGTVESPNPDSYTVESPAFTLQNPSRSGYTFLGWTTADEPTPSTSVTISSGTTGNLSFLANWQKNSSGGGISHDYTLHYVTNGGEHLSDETKSSKWTKDYEDLPTPEREGYTFAGWYWDLRLTEPVTGDVKVDKTTVTLYAKWTGEKATPDETGVSRWLKTEKHNAYLSGYPDGTFGPDKNMTRAEVAQMFYALLKDKNVAVTASFSDVPADAWYAKAVNTLASLGMLGGYPDGTFRPDAPITRAEFAAIALAFAYDPADASCAYTDVSAGAWYYTYVAQATTYGWIGGYPDGTFRPNNSITRAEVCVIVNNMLGRGADERYVDRNGDELVSFSDLNDNHWAYYTIMEATNTHDHTKDGSEEVWKTIP